MLDGRVATLLALGAMALTAVALLPPIPQDPAYHAFADLRPALGIPNAANVVSNAGFAVVGALGLGWVAKRAHARPAHERAAAAAFFGGVLLTAAGSAYYHTAPDDARLLWDRLPMTLAFMALFALVIGDRVGARAGRRLLGPLLIAGAASAIGWRLGDDLRWYGLVQFFPMLAIPLMLVMFPRRGAGGGWLWTALVVYTVAKVAESADCWLFGVSGISGHTMKHLASALAVACVLVMLVRRSAPAAG